MTNTFTPIFVVRIDERTGNLFLLAGDKHRNRNLSQWSLEILVIKPNFTVMSKDELRAYVIAHPDDKAAFHAFVDRFTAEAPPETFDIPNSIAEIEEVDRLIRQKLAQLKES
ncbi:MAG: hypothetical protein MJA27_23875 [Pseudanabaenales cyanobacterium]|nr:hypothetical protein [Pseudanabaenales cyanobacterium]